MTALPGMFDYPHRRPGLDHDWFDHRNLPGAAPVQWPNGARVALWVAVHMQHFPMDMGTRPFLPPGGMERPYPSYWDYTRRDYGNRVGVFRIMRALDRAGIRATAVMNAAVAARYPVLAAEVARRGWDVMASGMDMGRLHHGGLAPEEERALVQRAAAGLRGVFGPGVTGWHSPAHSESMNTLDLVAEAGFDHVADFVNDDMPYPVRTKHGPVTALPLAWEMSDQRALFQQHQASEEFEDAVLRAFRVLHAEGGRILAITVTPWIMGQPHRIRTLSRILDAVLSHGGVWPATAQDILAAWRAQQMP